MMKKVLFAFFSLGVISCTKMEAPITPTGSGQEFMGYKVDKNALAVSRQKDFGKSYWENLPVPADLFVGAFQKGVTAKDSHSFWLSAVGWQSRSHTQS